MTTNELICAAATAVWGPLDDDSTDNRRVHLGAAIAQVRDHLPCLTDLNECVGLTLLMGSLALALRHGHRFLPGETRKTDGLSDLSLEAATTLLGRHLKGDWGNLSDADKAANETALANGGRILSAYTDVHDGDAFWTKIWVITAEDAFGEDGPVNRLRTETLLLLPSEY